MAITRTRKIINFRFGPATAKLYALCDDGTLWVQAENGWSLLPDVPQYARKEQTSPYEGVGGEHEHDV